MTHDPPSSNASFVGSIPELYDRHLGPFFFEPFARDLVGRLVLPPTATAVLELAAGTGVLTKQLRRTLRPAVRLVATDLNAPMLDVAIAATKGVAGIEFREADATALPFADADFDAVVCQFGVMFFPDKDQAAREAKRVLRPGGEWLFNVWGSLAENPLAALVHETISGFFPSDEPQFYNTPFGYHDAGVLRELASAAGFTRVTVDDVPITVRAESAKHAAVGLVQGNPVANAIAERATVDAATVTAAVAERLAARFGSEPLVAPMLARVVSARR